MTTLKTLTNVQIASLRAEAVLAGDSATVYDCALAMNEHDGTGTAGQVRVRKHAARKRIVAVIRQAEAWAAENGGRVVDDKITFA